MEGIVSDCSNMLCSNGFSVGLANICSVRGLPTSPRVRVCEAHNLVIEANITAPLKYEGYSTGMDKKGKSDSFVDFF